MTPEAPLATGPATAPRPQSTSLSRLFTVFSSPGATFHDLAQDPHFILAWCIQIAVAVIYALVLVSRVGVYALARQALAQNPAVAAQPPQVYQHTLAITATIMKFTMYLAPVGTIVLMLILAAIFLGLGNFILGYEARYKQSLALVSYSYLAFTLYSILTLIVALITDPANFNLTNPIGTNIGFFLDKNTTSRFLYAFGTHIDIFAIWVVILLSIGLTRMGGKKGRLGGALSVVGVLWLLCVLAASGLAAL